MAHFAQINENNIVQKVVVLDDSKVEIAQEFLADTLGLGGTWIQTSYNTYAGKHKLGGTPLRFNYASGGDTYDAVRDAFISPQPHASWILNEETCRWEPTIGNPTDISPEAWDEENQRWDLKI